MDPSDATATPADGQHSSPTGGQALLAAQIAKAAIRLASVMVLARMLTPADYGVFGMAAVVHGFLYLVRDLGTSVAALQPDLTEARFDALCRFGLIGGLVIGAICAAAGPLAAFFFAEPRLSGILLGLALCFPFAGAAAPMQGLLYREQRVQTAALIDGAVVAAGSIAAVFAAVGGAGAWALVLGGVVNDVAACVLTWASCPWRPTWHRGERSPLMLHFGAHLSLHNIASYLARVSDQIVLARSAGAAALGIYGRGVQATALPAQLTVTPFTGMIVAALTRLRTNPPAYRACFRSMLNGLAHLVLPFAAVCIALPKPLVSLVYGPLWDEAVPVVRWLGIALALQPWLLAPSWLLTSVGRARRLMLLSCGALVLMGSAVLVARGAGLSGLAGAVTAASAISAVGMLTAALPATPATLADVCTASWRPWVLHSGLAALLAGVSNGLADLSQVLLVAAIIGAAMAYLIAVLGCWPKARRELREHFLSQR